MQSLATRYNITEWGQRRSGHATALTDESSEMAGKQEEV